MYSPEARLKSAHNAETKKNRNIMLYHMLRGLIKLKLKIKIREKVGLDRPRPPTPISNFYFLGVTCTTTKKQHINHKKTQFPSKDYQNELEFDPPTHFQFFLRFLDFF